MHIISITSLRWVIGNLTMRINQLYLLIHSMVGMNLFKFLMTLNSISVHKKLPLILPPIEIKNIFITVLKRLTLYNTLRLVANSWNFIQPHILTLTHIWLQLRINLLNLQSLRLQRFYLSLQVVDKHILLLRLRLVLNYLTLQTLDQPFQFILPLPLLTSLPSLLYMLRRPNLPLITNHLIHLTMILLNHLLNLPLLPFRQLLIPTQLNRQMIPFLLNRHTFHLQLMIPPFQPTILMLHLEFLLLQFLNLLLYLFLILLNQELICIPRRHIHQRRRIPYIPQYGLIKILPLLLILLLKNFLLQIIILLIQRLYPLLINP